MKKIITIGLITAIIIVLPGCTWSQSTEPAVEEPAIKEVLTDVAETAEVRDPEKIELKNANINDMIISQKNCESLLGQSIGDTVCPDEEARKEMQEVLIKLRDEGLSQEEWKTFNPLRISMGFENTDYIQLDQKNGILYFVDGVRTASGDAPATGGYYHLVSIFFDDKDGIYIATQNVGDFVYVGQFSVFSEDEETAIAERISENSAEVSFEKLGESTHAQLSANIKGDLKEGTFTSEEQRVIIDEVIEFKNYVEGLSVN